MARSTSSTKPAPAKPKRARFARTKQLWTVFTLTRKADPALVWWMLLAAAGTWAVALVIGILVKQEIYLLVLGLPLGLLAAMFVLARRAERSAYAQQATTPGVSVAVLQNRLRRGWNIEQQPIAVSGDPRSPDLVFRIIGRPGIVLVTEGALPRAARAAEQERKKVTRILPNVPVHLVHYGDGEGQVTARKLTGTVMKLRPALSKDEVSQVAKRLKALGAARPPIPQGIDPTRARPDRKASRGR